MSELTVTLPDSARNELRAAFDVLEHPSFAARLSSVVGLPLEAGLRLLGPSWERSIRRATESAIGSALKMMIGTLPETQAPPRSTNFLHAGACIATGAVGGFFGLPGLLIDLPITTGLILRSIADIARAQGESLSNARTRAACIEVFALGGPSAEDDAADTGYYGMRLAMAAHFSSFRLMLGQPVTEASLPGTVLAIRAVASRFGVAISDKAAAELVPVLGALAGALVNGLFIRHFQSMATGHFTVRRLERQYGADVVRSTYERFREGARGASAAPSTAPARGPVDRLMA